MSEVDLKGLLKRVVELVMPNLRHYYRLPRKGVVVKSYASDGSYWADVQPLRNDDSVDEGEPVISRVEIPILWGGPDRGLVCPRRRGPSATSPTMTGIRIIADQHFPLGRNKGGRLRVWGVRCPAGPGIFIKITPEGNIVHKTARICSMRWAATRAKR
jgi:hypothetical protein